MNIPNFLLEITIYSGVIYGIICLFQKVLADKISPRLHFLIWFLLVARLCIPITFHSPLNLIVIPENEAPQTAAPVMMPETGEAVSEVSGDDAITAVHAASETVAPQGASNPDSEAAQPVTKANQPIPWQMIVALIWVGGAALQVARTTRSAYRLKQTFGHAERETQGYFHDLFDARKKELKIEKDIPLYLTNEITTPALTIGVFPAIAMPYSALQQLSDTQVAFAMKHELMHFRRKDHLTGLLLKALEIVYWFNPVVWLLGKRMTEDMETACDNDVVHTMLPSEKKAYALTLVRLFSNQTDPVPALGMALDNRQFAAEKRIRGIYRKSKSKVMAAVVTIILCAFVFVGCFTTALQPVYEETQQTETSETPLELDATAQTVIPLVPEEKEDVEKNTAEQPDVYDPGMEIQTSASEDELSVSYEYAYTDTGVDYQPVSFTTSFDGSAQGRRYNIWKAGDSINGMEVLPGETWSFNEAVGERTYENGWRGAPGILEGVYSDIAGGGIDQAATTLYNAVLCAELEIVEQTAHTWPMGYVPGGLDATVSIDAPDFVFRNNLNVPVYILVECDGENEREITVSILRPVFEDGYERVFSSELTETFGEEETVDIPDPTLPEGTQQQLIMAHKGKTFQIYKELVDVQGNVVERAEFDEVTYQPKPAKVAVGTGEAAA